MIGYTGRQTLLLLLGHHRHHLTRFFVVVTDEKPSSVPNEMEVEPEAEVSNADLLHDAVKSTRETAMDTGYGKDHHDDYHPSYDEDDEDNYMADRAIKQERDADGMDAGKKECLKQFHKEIKNVLEREIVDILNEGTKQQLLALHGIGKKRAELIIQVCRSF